LPLESLMVPTKDVVVASCAAALKLRTAKRLIAVELKTVGKQHAPEGTLV